MSTFVQTIQYVFVDLFADAIRFPVWWYTKGLVLTLQWMGRTLKRYSESIALRVWMKNLFVPMYGLRDWQGRLISFFVRSVQIIFRGLFFVVYSFAIVVVLALYIAAPILVVIQVLYHFVGLFL